MVQWVVTVPAIWDIAARHVMKEAAVLAGIPQPNVVIALEPEAASIWCLKNQLELPSLYEHPFMVVDAGGGTVDITIHKMKTNGSLTEIHKPSGGSWGSTKVNGEFSKLLETLLGKEHANLMRNSDMWFSVMDSFEVVKLRFQDSPTEPAMKNINISALGAGANVQRISAFNSPGTAIQLTGGILRIPAAAFRKLFQPSLEKITRHINGLLANEACATVKHLFLVGGYAESPVLINEIRKSVGNRVQVICPPRPGSAVVIGAVQYGVDPEYISSRIAIRTIGVETCNLWNEELHRGRDILQFCALFFLSGFNRFIFGDDGNKRCAEAITTFITTGATIKANQIVCHNFWPLRHHQKGIDFNLYSSSKPQMPFSSDPGVIKIGKICIDLPPATQALPLTQRSVDLEMKFGGTVFSVTATCRNTGKTVSANFRFNLDPQAP